MRFSVIIPCHNAGRWVAQALQSVAAQTHPPHEIIVIDDGSTDDSLEQIKASGVDVKLLHSTCRNGAGTRNVGIKEATGEWIAFLDADDMWHVDHLEKMASLLEGTDDVGCIGVHDQLYEDGRVQTNINPWPIKTPTSGLSHATFASMWCTALWFSMITCVVRRDRLLEVGCLDPSQVRRHDSDMWLRVIHNNTWSYNPVASAVCRVDTPGSISRVNWASSEYYGLRCFIKNLDAYADTRLIEVIRGTARRAMSSALTDGTPEDVDRAKQLAWPYLSWRLRQLYTVASVWPQGFAAANCLRRRLHGYAKGS